MEAKFTPGPWKLDLDNSSYNPTRFHVIDKEYRRIVDVFGTYPRYAGTDEANAYLIAAAPELLEACENVAKDFGKERMDGCEGITDKWQCDKSACIDSDYCERREKLYSVLCAVIAKAKGEA